VTRPTIWKEPRFGSRPWCATNPYIPGIWQLCATWEEALEYVADALTNPFPLYLERADNEPIIVSYYDRAAFITDENDGDQIMLDRRHWRPLARALTRLADKEGVA